MIPKTTLDKSVLKEVCKRIGGNGITASEIEQAEEFNGQFTDVFNTSDHIEVPFLSR